MRSNGQAFNPIYLTRAYASFGIHDCFGTPHSTFVIVEASVISASSVLLESPTFVSICVHSWLPLQKIVRIFACIEVSTSTTSS